MKAIAVEPLKPGSVRLEEVCREWLGRLITRRVKPEDFPTALDRKPDDIKVVIQFSEV